MFSLSTWHLPGVTSLAASPPSRCHIRSRPEAGPLVVPDGGVVRASSTDRRTDVTPREARASLGDIIRVLVGETGMRDLRQDLG
jgi:hypothetical protein